MVYVIYRKKRKFIRIIILLMLLWNFLMLSVWFTKWYVQSDSNPHSVFFTNSPEQHTQQWLVEHQPKIKQTQWQSAVNNIIIYHLWKAEEDESFETKQKEKSKNPSEFQVQEFILLNLLCSLENPFLGF